jgi:hypothetical protein
MGALRRAGVLPVALAVALCVSVVVAGAPATASGRSVGAVADPSPTFPPITSWLSVFDDDFTGTFNGQPIVDTKNTRGAATADGLDDRVWVGTNYTDPEGISVTPTAAGGDSGSANGGYLNFRAYTEAGRTYNPDWLVTGQNEGSRRNLFSATYGYVEARLKLAQPDGANEAFFMYSQDLRGSYSKPLRDPAAAGSEIDIEEEFGPSDPDKIHHTLHWDGYGDTHQSEGSGAVACPGSSCRGNFHTYGVLWDPTGYRFFVDRQETYFLARGVSHHPLFMMIGAAFDRPGTDLGPKGDPRNALMLVDYVRIWQPAVSDIGNQTMQRNVPRAVPFTVTSVTSDDANLPGPRAATVEAVSSNQNVIRDADLRVAGTGADRTLGMMSRYSGGQAGTTTVTVRARNGAGTVIGSDTFTVTVGDPAASVPTLAAGALADASVAAGSPGSLEFVTPTSEGSAPTVTARSSNQYLLPDSNLGVAGDQRQRALAYTPRPTRTGTADVTVTATDPSDQSQTSDTFRITVTLADQLVNGGFESGLAPWASVGGTAPVVSGAAAHSGSTGLHQDVGAVVQHITVEPNTTYAVGAWGRTSASGGTFNFGVADTNTYPDWDHDGQPDDIDGQQAKLVSFDSTSWARKEVVFTTGNFTTRIDIVVGNAFISSIGYDLDDVQLVDAPKISQIPDQSIGHSTCVAPPVWVGRVGGETDPWTLTAAVTGGDASLITGVSVVSNNAANRYERLVRITPTTDVTKSGEATITLTATDTEGRQSTDAFTVWVNAGTFHDGSFEYNPFADSSYPGCSTIPRAWNNFFAPAARWERISSYDWRYGFTNYGLRVPRTAPSGGTPYGGIVYQAVTLQPNTEYVVSGWLDLDTWPDQGVTLPDGAQLWVTGSDLTFISPTTGKVARTTTGWSGRLSVRFRTGASGNAQVELRGPNHATYTGLFHDITLIQAT